MFFGISTAIAIVAFIFFFTVMVTSYDDGPGCMGIIAVIALWFFFNLVAGSFDKKDVKKTTEQHSEQTIKNDCSDGAKDINKDGKCSVADQPKVEEAPPPPPKEEPKKEEQPADPYLDSDGKFNFDKWAQNSVVKGKSIVCDDGVQINVSAWVYTSKDDSNYGNPSAYSVWPRVHQDGTPYKCNDPKNPTQEPKL